MILTTTPTIEGRTIVEYKGVVFGEVIAGVDFLRDIAASIRKIVGGSSGSYEEELINAREQAMDEMRQRAQSMGADAVVGIDDDAAKASQYYNMFEAEQAVVMAKEQQPRMRVNTDWSRSGNMLNAFPNVSKDEWGRWY